ncbi:Bromodomain-containing protein 8 [Liparis tanakae]|uniref:Bromodomain-containing protein 8 n=1 Tax=Liparis tanakae TaxID=230148 RepID=A0A4Z2GEH7_9TELE|nr:Bromodomain-containing protein 8 [Liparis tanakae]
MRFISQIGEGDGTSAHMTGAHDLQPALPSQPLAQATEVDVTEPSSAPGCQPVTTEDEVAELGEEGVSYMGEELDLKTTDVSAEALDAAAVEAALSLCEENGHALPGAWERPPHRSGPGGKTAAPGVQGATSTSPPLSSPLDSRDSVLEDSSLAERHPEGMKAGGEKASGTKAHRKLIGDEEADGAEGAEGFLSEPDGETEPEPAASGSEDGSGLHTAPSSLQLHTATDSIPSSPASSQL